MWASVKIEQGAGRDEVFASAFAAGKEEWNVGDLLGECVDGAIDPDDLLICIGEDGAG